MNITSQILNTLKGNLNFVPLDTDDVLNDDREVAGTKVVHKEPKGFTKLTMGLNP